MNKRQITPPRRALLLDIMLGQRFVCQLRYTKRGMPEMINGQMVEVHQSDDLQAFVEQQRPSLKGKNYNIEFATQRV